MDDRASTNPFLDPAFNETNRIDAQTFLENVALGNHLVDEPLNVPSTSRSTNPFLNYDNELSTTKENTTTNDVDVLESFLKFPEAPSTEPESQNQETETHSLCDLLKDIKLTKSNEDKPMTDKKDNAAKKIENNNKILNYYDTRKWRIWEFISLRVSNIYSPSTFWVVPRYKELELFMEYLSNYYSENKQKFKLAKLSLNMYCIVYTNNVFYRGILVSYLPDDRYRVKVFLIDYGTLVIVLRDDLFKLDEHLYEIPQFSVRASLAYICPRNENTWTGEVVNRFRSLVSNKTLVAQVVNTDDDRKILELTVGTLLPDNQTVSYANKKLMDEGFAKYTFDKMEKHKKNTNEPKSLVKFLYLYPTFELIESGQITPNVHSSELLKETAAYSILTKHYFQEQEKKKN